ncbi:MAG TPA: TIGR01777 family oxidoreductase [Acidimicrobiia bacterium]|nr:TIGR01777 family oxidoreductase [Acidimicrobiia bacterium]
MDVLVTGAHGLIGTALLPCLRADGHRVVRLVRDQPEGSDDVRWDPAAGTIDAAGLEGIDAVVHLAGAGIGDKKWTAARKQLIVDSRTEGTGLLARTLAGLDRPPRVLLSGSAVGYYGDGGAAELTEASPPGDDFPARVCVAWEAATAPAEEAGIRVVHLRTGIVLAAHGGALHRMLLPFRLGLGGRIGSGEQYLSWITLDDHVGAMRHLLATDSVGGAVNLTAPNPVTNAEFTRALGSSLHRPTALPTPLLPLKAVYGAELVERLLVIGQRVLPRALEASGYEFAHREIDDALRAVLAAPAAA